MTAAPMTYGLLSIAVLIPVLGLSAVVLVVVRASGRALAAAGVALAVLVVLTAVFDSVIVGSGIVAYDPSRILGLRLGVAPIEDFAYPIAAAAALPALWLLLGRRRAR